MLLTAMVRDDTPIERRNFLKVTAASGLAGASALAGCSGGGGGDETTTESGDDGDEETTTESSDGGEETTESSDGGAEMGEPLPSYRYLNNPANYNPARHDAINLIADQLDRTGLDVSTEVFEWGTLYSKITSEYEFSFATWNRGLGIDPGRRMPAMFHSSNTDPGQGNFTGYVNEDLDPILMEQLQVTDVDERIDMLYELQSILNEDVPMHPIVQMPNVLPYNNEQVSGWVSHLAGYNAFEPQTNIEVDNEDNTLRGTWPETLGTLNVLGYNNETKLNVQFDMIYDQLIRINRNLEVDYEMSLATATSRESAEDVTYTIREGHKWHDGEDLTPEDVKFSIEYIKENEVPLYSTQNDMVDSVEVDGQDVTVNFANPVGPVHTLFSNQIPIIPQHTWSERDSPNNATVTEPIGSGPLAFDYWDQGSELSLVKNEDHFYPVNYDRRVWRIIPESSTTWELLLSGELNYLPFGRIGRPLAQNSEEEQISVESAPGDGWWHFSQNTRMDGLSDPAVRRALVWAIPKQAVNDQLLYGYATQGWNLIGESFGQYSNPDVPKYQGGGVERSKEVLREAGYVFDDEGTVHFPAE
jgi:peptide/nickel transport system substrate-binding protein